MDVARAASRRIYDVKFGAVGGLFDRGQNAVTSTFIARVGKGG